MKLLSLIVLLTFSFSLLPASETDDTQQAIMDARRDSNQNITEEIWLMAGCLCGVFGIGFAYFHQPQIPIVRMVGKSPEYVAFYTEEYRYQARRKQTTQALIGCIGTTILQAVIVMMNPHLLEP